MESKLNRLHIDMPKSQYAQSTLEPAKPKDVVDSWEEDVSSESDTEPQTPLESPDHTLKPITSNTAMPNVPPPTPMLPKSGTGYVDWQPATALGGGRPQSYAQQPSQDALDEQRKRPEKTTAAAGRMIAAGLGLKAPKKTEEQRKYDRATREQEIRRKNREKEDKEREKLEDEKAKAAVWDS